MKILKYPHPLLRGKCQPVKVVDAKFRANVAQMRDLLCESGGVGLAANQVGLPLKFFVTEFITFINPTIRRSREWVIDTESCLSFPELVVNVARPMSIDLIYFDLSGQEFDAITIEGKFARLIHHEVDHLNGVVLTDRLSDTEKLRSKKLINELGYSG